MKKGMMRSTRKKFCRQQEAKRAQTALGLRGIDANVRFGQHLLALVARPVGAAAFCALLFCEGGGVR